MASYALWQVGQGRGRALHPMALTMVWASCFGIMALAIKGTIAEVIPGPSLKPVANWDVVDGKATRTDIFCSNSIGSIRTPTVNEARTLQALCNRTGPDYYSNRGLDAFLAGRFAGRYSYDTAGLADPVWAKHNTKPYSTEANTPWMLADYLITQTQSVSRADSWKRVAAEAQIDVLVCTDPACEVLVDMQNISSQAGQPSTRAVAFFGVQNIIHMGLATVNQTMSSSILEKQHWVPAQVNVSGSQSKILEVAWRVENATIMNEHGDNTSVYISDVVALAAVLNINSSYLQVARLGFYKAQTVMGTAYLNKKVPCIALLWPDHPWMEAHGWAYSDPLCVKYFQHIKVKGIYSHFNMSEYVRVFVTAAPVFIFDSYFNQARVLGNRSRVLATITYADLLSADDDAQHHKVFASASYNVSYGGNITNDTVAVYLRNITSLDAPIESANDDNVEIYSLNAGRYGTTFSIEQWLLGTYVDLETQAFGSCILPCKRSAPRDYPTFSWEGGCAGRCVVLSIGSATIAAEVMQIGSDPEYPDIVTALRKFRVLAGRAEYPPPWCSAHFWPLAPDDWSNNMYIYGGDDTPISVLVEHISSPLLLSHGRLVDPRFTPHLTSGLLQNCSFWDTIGVGYAHGATTAQSSNVPQSDQSGLVHTLHLLDASTQFWLWVRDGQDEIRSNIMNSDPVARAGDLAPFLLDQALQGLVSDAALLVDLNLSQQLATTDFTKTWAGALLDITVTIVAVVAMASGCGDIMAWLHTALNRWAPRSPRHAGHLARVITSLVVCSSLIVAPVISLVGEVEARANDSNTGANSRVGTVARDTGSGVGPYVVVGIVTIKMTTQYDKVGFALECANLGLACLAAILICVDLLWPSNRWRLQRRQANQRRLLRQLAFKDPNQQLPEV